MSWPNPRCPHGLLCASPPCLRGVEHHARPTLAQSHCDQRVHGLVSPVGSDSNHAHGHMLSQSAHETADGVVRASQHVHAHLQCRHKLVARQSAFRGLHAHECPWAPLQTGYVCTSVHQGTHIRSDDPFSFLAASRDEDWESSALVQVFSIERGAQALVNRFPQEVLHVSQYHDEPRQRPRGTPYR